MGETVRIFGRSSIENASGESIDIQYQCTYDRDSGRSEISIWSLDDVGKYESVYSHISEPGDEFVKNMGVVRIRRGVEFVAVWSEVGATSLGLRLVRILKYKPAEVVFEERSRYGFRIVEVTDDEVDDIVVGYGDIGGGAKQMIVYAWDGGGFQLVGRAEVEQPHQYQIRASNSSE